MVSQQQNAPDNQRKDFFRQLKVKKMENKNATITDIETLKKTFQTTELMSKQTKTSSEQMIALESSDSEFVIEDVPQGNDEIQSKGKLEIEEEKKEVEFSESEESDDGLTRRKQKDVRTMARVKELKT